NQSITVNEMKYIPSGLLILYFSDIIANKNIFKAHMQIIALKPAGPARFAKARQCGSVGASVACCISGINIMNQSIVDFTFNVSGNSLIIL
ncbi:MAG: hypothetical protein JW973_16430, partial [Bacteroidales bacterium]|nr:hypothetical protein [Bacteroidales bacterium]